MAKLERAETGGSSSRRRARDRPASPEGDDDWARTPDFRPEPPSPGRRGEIRGGGGGGKGKVQRRPEPDSLSNSTATPTSSRHPRQTHAARAQPSASSSSGSTMRVPVSAMPRLTRASTVPYRRPTTEDIYPYNEESSRDNHPGQSHRHRSPRPTQRYKSTTDSRKSSRDSVSESEEEDEETEVTISTPDEKSGPLSDKNETVRSREHRRHQRDRPREKRTIYEELSDDGESTRSASRDGRTTASRSKSRSQSREARGSGSQYSADRPTRDHNPPREHRRGHIINDAYPPSSSKRPSRRYYEAESAYIERPPSLRRSNTTGGSQVTSSQSSVASSKRSSGFLSGFFGPGLQSTPAEKAPPKLYECVVCMDDVPSAKAAKLKCGHRMCNSCLKRSFRLSITDPQHMPPKCCTSDLIPLKHVERLFDNTFKKTWNRKFHEFSTRNRIYCPSRRCGEWIKPENIHREDGRRVGKCSRCKTKVCGICNGKWHASRECPKDEETNKFLEQAKEEGWQRCFRCKAMVELKEGCNHMTCRCGAEFCMICGTKWKSCECPWFSYDTVEADRLMHMNPPLNPMRARFEPPAGAGRRTAQDELAARRAVRTGGHPRNMGEEMFLRRQQEQRDEELARRLQAFGEFDDLLDGDILGVGNNAGHLMNENFRRRPQANLVVPPPPSPPHASPFERANTVTNYVSGVNRARGVRATSLERRLADRFNPESRWSSAHHRPAHGPPGSMPVPVPMPMPMPQSPQTSHMHGGPPSPTAPSMQTMPSMMPPLVASPVVSLPRRHTIGDEHVHDHGSLSERTTPSSRRSNRRDSESQVVVTTTSAGRWRTSLRQSNKGSVLAGLTGPGSGMDRVHEWRAYVEPGAPENEEQVLRT